jgi:hypothetical protein
MGNPELTVSDDFEYLLGFLPQDWREMAKELGALRRCRKVPDAETLLRVLLIHLAEGCSLRETALRAKRGNLISLSDVAIMDRLRQSGEWFRWMNTEIMQEWVAWQPVSIFGSEWRVRVVDGTRLKEPGPTGSSWCVHYSIELPSLACDELHVSESGETGETFRRFNVQQGDLFVGDRAYGVRSSIFHVVKHGGEVLVRFAASNLPLETQKGQPFSLLKKLRTLSGTKIGDWRATVKLDKQTIRGRICAIKKSRQATERAQKRVVRQAQKGGYKPKPETLEAAGYTFVFTTIPRNQLCPSKVLEMYRGRWQIELVFKRLKSILQLGHLRKADQDAARAWIHGKLFVAFLVESLIRHAESFFPWGFPLHEIPGTQPLSLAGGTIHASSPTEHR